MRKVSYIFFSSDQLLGKNKVMLKQVDKPYSLSDGLVGDQI